MARNKEVADEIARHPNTGRTAASHRAVVPYFSPRAGSGTRVRSDKRRMIVRFSRSGEVHELANDLHLGRYTWHARQKYSYFESPHYPGVVVECFQRSVIQPEQLERLLHDLEQRSRHLDAVDHLSAFEEPVPAVLAIRVTQLEQLDISRIALQYLREEAEVVREVRGIHAEAKRFVRFFEHGHTAAQEINDFDGLRHDAGIKADDPQ